MPRRLRESTGGMVYHVLNRTVGREPLFQAELDYIAFERILAEAIARHKSRLLAYCILPNHWHLLLWPHEDGELSDVMRWLTVTHTQRYHAYYQTSGTGPLYQGRFKSFPVQSDEHFYTVARYVERNALTANLAARAEAWPWGSLALRLACAQRSACEKGSGVVSATETTPDPFSHAERPTLTAWPVEVPSNWPSLVNEPLTAKELDRVRTCVARGRPYGSENWVNETAKLLNLESTLRSPGRPRTGR